MGGGSCFWSLPQKGVGLRIDLVLRPAHGGWGDVGGKRKGKKDLRL